MIIGEVGKERQESCGFLLQLDQSNLKQQSMKQLHQSSVILLDPMHLKVKQTKEGQKCVLSQKNTKCDQCNKRKSAQSTAA